MPKGKQMGTVLQVDDTLSPVEAAIRAGLSVDVIRSELRSRRLLGIRAGGRWFIHPTDLETWMNARGALFNANGGK